MKHVDTKVKKESDARKKAMKGMKAALQAQNEDLQKRLTMSGSRVQ